MFSLFLHVLFINNSVPCYYKLPYQYVEAEYSSGSETSIWVPFESQKVLNIWKWSFFEWEWTVWCDCCVLCMVLGVYLYWMICVRESWSLSRAPTPFPWYVLNPISFFVAIIKFEASLWRPYRTALPVVHLVYLFEINILFMSCMSDAIWAPEPRFSPWMSRLYITW